MAGDIHGGRRVTKGTLPSLPRWTIPRPRLTETLLDTPEGGVVVMTAPSGFGSTTAAAAAARAAQGTVAWIDTALAGLGPTVVEGMLVELAPDWIVVDGINPESGHDAVVRSLAQRMSRARLIVTTHDPTWMPELPPSRALRIDARALAFSDDEIVSLALALQPDVDADEVDRLVELAAGWPIAVVRAIRHARTLGSRRPSEWLELDGCDDLMGPWIRALPEPARRLLESTAVLDRLAQGLCDAVTGEADTGHWLDWLASQHAFLREDPLTDIPGHQWFERHPLLTLALRRRQRGMDVTAMHARAAEWFSNGPGVDAHIRHLLGAGQTDEAADVLLQYENELLEHGAADRVVKWYAELPESVMGTREQRLLRIGWGRALSGDRQGAQLAARQLGTIMDTEGIGGPREHEDAIRGELSLLHSYTAALSGDTREMLRQAQLSVERLTGDLARNSAQLAPLMLVRGRLWSGDPVGAARELERLEGRPFVTDLMRESVYAGLRSLVLTCLGRVREGSVIADMAAGWHASQGLPLIHGSSVTAAVAFALAEVESARLDRGIPVLQDVFTLARDRQMIGEAVFTGTLLARAELARGNTRRALLVLEESQRLLATSCPRSALGNLVRAAEAEVRIRLGDLTRAERIISTLPMSDDRTYLSAWVGLLRRPSSAESALSGVDADSPRHAARIQLLLALAGQRRSMRLAEIHLLRAADIAEESGMELLLVPASDELLLVAESAARRAGHDPLMRRVVTARALRAVAERGESDGRSWPALSRGEIELLGLLNGRETNAEIAAALGISLNTVKTRLSRLYRKLGVGSRNELLKVARDTGLLG